MAVGDVAFLGPGADDEHHTALGVDVVGFAAGVVFGDEDGHVFPVRRVGEEVDDATEGEIVIGHVGGLVGVAFVGAAGGAVVVADGDVDEAWEFPFVFQEAVFDVLDEPVGTVLVGDVGVEDGEIETGVVVEDVGHGHVDDFAGTGFVFVGAFDNAGEFEAFAVVTERYSAAGEVFPHGTGFGVILRHE